VFYKNADRFRAQLRSWTPALLAHALSLLVEAEVQCKTTGFPDTAICGRLVIQLARGPKRRAG
jgi:DNA polymerase-3 subunit delta